MEGHGSEMIAALLEWAENLYPELPVGLEKMSAKEPSVGVYPLPAEPYRLKYKSGGGRRDLSFRLTVRAFPKDTKGKLDAYDLLGRAVAALERREFPPHVDGVTWGLDCGVVTSPQLGTTTDDHDEYDVVGRFEYARRNQ